MHPFFSLPDKFSRDTVKIHIIGFVVHASFSIQIQLPQSYRSMPVQ